MACLKFCTSQKNKDDKEFEFYINNDGNIFFQEIDCEVDITQSWGIILKEDWEGLKKFIDQQYKEYEF